ncbi:hypothetical protein GCM10010149_82600 [Nonomuraea roseoviolacea subsp. roseoviolacea]|uniref:hypothetical protein n=1 Tax=Nonomuraea roseoviolacea TaxID=103837 RepID=UPI0031D6A7CD
MTRASKRVPVDGATAHVLARAGGPLALGAGAPAPPGMLRLTRPDSTGQALPVWPDGVTPALLEEHQVAPVPVERSGETRRVLAACLKCCWTDHSVDPWPGEPAPVELVLATYRALIGRTDDLMRNWAVGALRRLHDSAWVVMADGLVTLGPRCALWPVSSLAQLKELVRRIPEPERQELRVVADSDIVAAARATTGTEADQDASQGSAPEGAVPAEPAAGAVESGSAAVETPLGGEPGQLLAEGGRRGSRAAGAPSPGGRAEAGVSDFDDLLDGYDERRRAELVAAYMVVEYAAEPAQEARFAALRDPALRHTLGEMLARRGRTLIQHRERWISGYSDETATRALGRLRESADTGLPGSGLPGETGDPGSLDRSGGTGDAARLASAADDTGAHARVADTTVLSADTSTSPGGTNASPADTDASPVDVSASFAGASASPARTAAAPVAANASPADIAAGAVAATASTGGEPGNSGALAGPGRARSRRGPVGPGVSNGPGGSTGLGEAERAVLTLVLVHSVAIPRAEGVLPEDTWLSPHPTPAEELRRHTQVPIGELEAALRVLRHAGLLAQVKAGEEAGGYVPGPQFHRLTPAARRRLQEELILAAGPHTPLATAVRARRSGG